MSTFQTTGGGSLAQTPLYNLHREHGAKMVPFAGYEMPVQYPMGIMKEHTHTRTHAGLFDVSHMGQVRISGPQAAEALERLVPVDVLGLGVNRQRYGLLTNDAGGILDDLMISNAGDHLFVVVNAACKESDLAHMREQIGGECVIEELNDRALIALQGPVAGQVMARIAPAAAELVFMTTAYVDIDGASCFVTRSGYTGEDGFEISVPADRAADFARKLLEFDEVAPIGLGARDTLRLEAGLCLYGHDIDRTTTPVEANLNWAISKARRSGGARAGGFPGARNILAQMVEGASRKRVGIRPEGRAPVREGADLVDAEGNTIGWISSGGFGPTVGGPVAMGYVAQAHAGLDTQLQAVVRGKPHPVRVAKLPFVQQRYFRG
jgi:aminomethyltransferase